MPLFQEVKTRAQDTRGVQVNRMASNRERTDYVPLDPGTIGESR